MSTIFTPPAEDDDLVITPENIELAPVPVAQEEEVAPVPVPVPVPQEEVAPVEEEIDVESLEVPSTLYLGKETVVTDSVWDFGNSTVLCIDPVEDKMVANKKYIDERVKNVDVDELSRSLQDVVANLQAEVTRAKKSEADLKVKVDLLCQYLFKTTKPNKKVSSLNTV